jgi:hypothetical protein
MPATKLFATKTPATKMPATKVFSTKMISKRLLISTAIILASAWSIAGAQNASVVKGRGTTVWGKHAAMTVVTEAPRSVTSQSVASQSITGRSITSATTGTNGNGVKKNSNESGLVTIFSNLAREYPNGEFWCCTGYNIMGPASGIGEQWMGAAFTPHTNHTVTKISVAVGYSQGTTNGAVLSLRLDNNGVPGTTLKGWTLSALPVFGTCCALVEASDLSGIPISGGQQYWVVLKTNTSQLDTVDAWNVDDTDQVHKRKLAVFPGAHNAWYVFRATPGLAFSVEGSN